MIGDNKKMITHLDDGSRTLYPIEYCVVNDIQPITKEDCVLHIDGDGTSVEEFFKNDFDHSKFGKVDPTHNVWRSYFFYRC